MRHLRRRGAEVTYGVLLAFDLDKTLLTNDYQLPTGIERSVKAARDAGHLVTVLTGRPLASAVPFLEVLGIDVPHSVNHGSMIRGADGSVIRRLQLHPDEVRGLLDRHYQDSDIEFTCVVGETLHVRDPEHERWEWAHTANRNVAPYRLGTSYQADKVVFHCNGRSRQMDETVAGRYPNLLRYLWGDGYLEVVPEGGDKGTALALIAEMLGVARRDVIAFGDGLNDVTMIDWAGYGVAVGPDADERVLAVADERIAAPEIGGVSRWIESNLL